MAWPLDDIGEPWQLADSTGALDLLNSVVIILRARDFDAAFTPLHKYLGINSGKEVLLKQTLCPHLHIRLTLTWTLRSHRNRTILSSK